MMIGNKDGVGKYLIVKDFPMYLDRLFYRERAGSSDSKEFTCSAEDPSSIFGLERSLEEEMATHSSILAWRIP